MDQWLAEAKASENADKCGMFLTHNGIVRSTAKAQVRQGEEMPAVAQVDFSYDATRMGNAPTISAQNVMWYAKKDASGNDVAPQTVTASDSWN